MAELTVLVEKQSVAGMVEELEGEELELWQQGEEPEQVAEKTPEGEELELC
jgi:hypothetical protein